MSRSRYWAISLPFWIIFWILFAALDRSLGLSATNVLTILWFVPAFFLSTKRLHDTDKSAWRLLIVLIPVIGPIWAFIELGCRGGTKGSNRYGEDPLDADYDYMTVE